jgi:formamidopyrimidine-DNA glycosylase
VPELPEVESICKQLKSEILFSTITSVTVKQHSLRYKVKNDLAILLKDRVIESITRRGRYIILKLDYGSLIFHFGMSGSLHFVNDCSVWNKHDHIEFKLSNAKVLRYHDPRRFGFLLYELDDPYIKAPLHSLGLEPFDEKLTPSYLQAFAKKRLKTSIKQFIMDNSIVTGVGNIYANEALFYSKIHPTRICNTITDCEFALLIKNIKEVLQRSISLGGTTLRDYITPNGDKGIFRSELAVYERANQKCKVCNELIQVIKLNQRSAYFCSQCQK